MEQPEPYNFVMLLIGASQVITDRVQAEVNRAGFNDVNSTHGFVFLHLSHGATTGQELAHYLGVTKQAASQMIEYLERQGYVERQPSPNDARNKLVSLTNKGWACIAASEKVLRGLQREWAALIGQARLTDLNSDLQKIVQAANEGRLPNKLRSV